ncbi:pilus assembly protein TadG-related protein [Bosea sp. 124]|uniref:TadE/TadG family type IV pilus assembly protein n=1 Tax=Bosea sp. 124 TaxID=2135642 RepID=UPI000D382A81|nr:pilus assembly protein TadG-related protein [Bosea sp. 124]PTM41514.1 putative Flp pilus-assembly TadE/G-like protein [Bosea sp. 124]
MKISSKCGLHAGNGAAERLRARRLGCEFARNDRGGVLTMFAMALPALLMGAGVVVDYGILSTQKTVFQLTADSAALAAAREFRLANASAAIVQTVAEKFATTALQTAKQTGKVAASVDPKRMSVTVEITNIANTNIMHMFGSSAVEVGAKATARVQGSASICVIGLELDKKEAIYLEKDAKLEAPDCAVYSNSRKRDGLKAMQNSSIKARFICSAGGSYKDKYDAFSPAPTLDCPVINDPLASRPAPPMGGCTATDLKITATTTLYPGTYCGGIRISKTAVVNLSPGIYAFKDGPLDVAEGAALVGQNVGIFLNGKGSVVRFDANTRISLTAPKDGALAGILFFEDRNSPVDQKHEILSNDAKVLLGTIYMPRGELNIGANQPVAAESAYTIVVTKRFTLSAGPTMVLNTRYGSTDIPVPAGVGPGATAPQLTQ